MDWNNLQLLSRKRPLDLKFDDDDSHDGDQDDQVSLEVVNNGSTFT